MVMSTRQLTPRSEKMELASVDSACGSKIPNDTTRPTGVPIVQERPRNVGKTKIAWTDFTFNPWWGCLEVSPACDNCYAREWDARFAGDTPHWGKNEPRRF